MKNKNRNKVRRAERQFDAKARQRIYDNLSLGERLHQTDLRRGESRRERERILGIIWAQGNTT